jgi:hypothetical protein
LDPDGSLGINDPKQKYLYSQPSEWTGWVRPTFPEIQDIKLISHGPDEIPYDLLVPTVEFNFILNERLFLKATDFKAKPIFYRIIVKRKVKNSISTFTDNNNSSTFIEVGELINIPVLIPAGHKPFIITDVKIEREDMTSEIILDYKIEVSVIAIDTNDKIYILRKEKIKNLNVKISPPKQNKEVKKLVVARIE